ncbi:N-acetylmuramoyl-L-alanine amidase [Ktedonobacteria bacterium brp13]|nr:N-acetylmuramoyl-L-alanine amidase [Ktedonobacteria bacterium brp13]
MIGQQGVIQMPNNNFFANREGLRAKHVILHGTAGGSSAQNIASYFAQTQGTNNPVSSHYVVGQDGTIVQCVSESDGAWANGILTAGHASFWDTSINPNNTTISIEHVKSATDNSNALTPAQQAASFKLIADICDRWQIPKRAADGSGGITGHFSLDPVNRSNCPGPYNWNALWAYLNGQSTTPPQEENIMIELSTPGVSQFWAPSADGYWRCIAPGHDHRVGGDILSFYKRFGNSGLCGLTYLGLPLTDEFVPKSGTSAQFFEHGVVVRDPNRVIDRPAGLLSTEHCYLAHLDSGFAQVLVSQPLTTPLNGKIKSLEAQLSAAQNTGGDPAEIAALQAQIAAHQATITTLQAQAVASAAKIQQAIALLQK